MLSKPLAADRELQLEFANKSAASAASLDYIKYQGRDQAVCLQSLPGEDLAILAVLAARTNP